MTTDEFGGGVHDDVGAPFHRAAQRRRRERRVDRQREAVRVGHVGKGLDVGDRAGRVADRLGEQHLRVRLDGSGKAVDVGRIDKRRLDAEASERVGEHRDGAPVEVTTRHDVITGLCEGGDGEELCGVAR